MSERPRRDDVDAGGRDLRNRLQSDIAAGFDDGAAVGLTTLATDLADGAVDSVLSTYLEHATANPLGSVIELTRAGESSLGQK